MNVGIWGFWDLFVGLVIFWVELGLFCWSIDLVRILVEKVLYI